MLFHLLFHLFALICAAPVEENETAKYRIPLDLSYLGNTVFGEPDEVSGARLENWDGDSDVNPDELGNYAEGDILFPFKSRSGLISEVFRWKDAVVPYEISTAYPEESVDIINRAINMYHKYTCVTFRPKTDEDKDYISIAETRTGCWSSIGRVQGKQVVNLQNHNCTQRIGVIIHELMHTLGFIHEQSRPERDDFVDINFENIREEKMRNFEMYDTETVTNFGVDYDYSSVMHYSNKAFTKNGKITIVTKAPNARIGQREGFSVNDIMKINKMYNCSNKEIILTRNIELPGADPNVLTN